MTIAELSSKRI